jgi:hypothetical protein
MDVAELTGARGPHSNPIRLRKAAVIRETTLSLGCPQLKDSGNIPILEGNFEAFSGEF